MEVLQLWRTLSAMATNRSKLVKKLDKVFSIYIRRRPCDENGYANCFTCGKRHHWKEVDAGHFMSRAKMATRWNEDNVQFQCKRCNGFRSGEQYKFAQELGKDLSDDLVFRSNQPARFSMEELRDKIEYFKQKIENLEG